MFNWLTADGYFAGADGNLGWVVPDDQQAKAAADGIPGFDTESVRLDLLEATRYQSGDVMLRYARRS